MIRANFSRLCLLWLIVNVLGACAIFRKECPPDIQKNAEIHMKLGREYMQRGQYNTALNRLQKALNYCSTYAEAHHVLAVLYERVGENDKADAYYQKAVTLKPGNSNIHNNYGQFLCQRDLWQEADKHFLKALEDPMYSVPEIPYTNAGLCALRNEDSTRAETYFRKALQKNPQFPRALYQMASLSYEQKRYQQAHDYLHRYSKIANHTPQTLWLGIHVERILNNKDTEASYILLLRNKFPDSRETQLLNQSEKP